MSLVHKIKSKIRREVIHTYRDIKHTLGADTNFYKQASGNRILIYHGICQTDHTRFNPIFLNLKTFEQHLKYYKKYFKVLSLDDYYNERFCRDKFNICLTFDDGFANNYKYVLPLLQQYQIPATFFITAICKAGYDILWNDFLGIVSKYGPSTINYKGDEYGKDKFNKYYSLTNGTRLVDTLRSAGFTAKAEMMEILYPLMPFKNNPRDIDYWLQMTESEIQTLAASPYVTIGGHGYYHNDLSLIDLSESVKELQQSKTYLENLIQKQVNSLAFPYGSYTRPLAEAAKSIGYDQLLAMDLLFSDDHQDITMRERFTVNPFISPNNQMYATINRRYEQ
jgi:peptidoglycan/xylan/chitin deacetylase (PgdA/CDA1 family)